MAYRSHQQTKKKNLKEYCYEFETKIFIHRCLRECIKSFNHMDREVKKELGVLYDRFIYMDNDENYFDYETEDMYSYRVIKKLAPELRQRCSDLASRVQPPPDTACSGIQYCITRNYDEYYFMDCMDNLHRIRQAFLTEFSGDDRFWWIWDEEDEVPLVSTP